MPTTFSDLIGIFLKIISTAAPVVISLASLAFLWGLAKFIFRVGGSEDAVEEGKNLMLWGIIALFLMFAVWGIISFFHNDIGFRGPIRYPLLPP